MASEKFCGFAFGKIAAYAGGKRGPLDEAGDLLIVKPVGADRLALAGDAPAGGDWRRPGEG